MPLVESSPFCQIQTEFTDLIRIRFHNPHALFLDTQIIMAQQSIKNEKYTEDLFRNSFLKHPYIKKLQKVNFFSAFACILFVIFFIILLLVFVHPSRGESNSLFFSISVYGSLWINLFLSSHWLFFSFSVYFFASHPAMRMLIKQK